MNRRNTRSQREPANPDGTTTVTARSESQEDPRLEEVRNTLDVSTIELPGSTLDSVKRKLDAVLKEDPNDYKAYTELARYHLKIGYRIFKPGIGAVYDAQPLKNAYEAVIRAIELQPTYADAYIPYGSYFEGVRDYTAAEVNYEKADSLGSDNPWLYERWGRLLWLLDRNDEAMQKFKKVLSVAGDNKYALGSAYELIARIHEARHEYEDADSFYSKLIETLPGNAWTLGSYSEFLRAKVGDIDRAIQFGEEALSLSNYGVGRRILAMALYAKWGQSVVTNPDDSTSESYLSYAMSLYSDLNYAFFWLAQRDTTSASTDPFLRMGVRVDTTDKVGYTALSWAAMQSQLVAAEHLLQLGANPKVAGNDGWLPLHQAAYTGNLEMFELLLKHTSEISDQQLNFAKRVADQQGSAEIKRALEDYVRQ